MSAVTLHDHLTAARVPLVQKIWMIVEASQRVFVEVDHGLD
jgi:hypothetical protein